MPNEAITSICCTIMTFHIYATMDAVGFYHDHLAYWTQNEAQNNLIMSIVSRAVKEKQELIGWSVTKDNDVVLTAAQTPPHPLLISHGCEDASMALATHFEGPHFYVSGPVSTLDKFVTQWQSRHDLDVTDRTEMTFFMLETLISVSLPEGSFNIASEADLDRLLPLMIDGAAAMGLAPSLQRVDVIRPQLKSAIADRRQAYWEVNGKIVSIARYASSLPDRGARIGGVYTCLAHRKKGIASALVGSLANSLFENGQKWVSLFADNANTTSTQLYQRLGFRPVFQSATVSFKHC
ncbi:MAG: GNAT family N-acetyltransferase [Pseudomonadota bacterium]